jgi:hypothetical protein
VAPATVKLSALELPVVAVDLPSRLHLQDAIVVLQLMDDGRAPCSPEAYRCAAASARRLVWEGLRRVPIHEFQATFDALQETADNLYFESRGRFADIGHSGAALAAQQTCNDLLTRLRAGQALEPPGRAPHIQRPS